MRQQSLILICCLLLPLQTALKASAETHETEVAAVTTDGHPVSEGRVPPAADKLPELDLSPYRQELEYIKKLQRDNLKLQLEQQRDKLQKKSRTSLDDPNIEDLKILEIFSTRQRLSARLFIPGVGIRVVTTGEKVADVYQITRISHEQVLVKDLRDASKKAQSLGFYYGGS